MWIIIPGYHLPEQSHQFILILGFIGVGGDGPANDHLDGTRVHSAPAPGQNRARTADAYRHNGLPGFYGQNKPAFFKRQHLRRAAPGPFRKDDNGAAFPHRLGRPVDAPHGGLPVAAVHRQGARPRQGNAKEGYGKELDFGQKFYRRQHGQQHENIKGALMIGGVDGRASWFQILPAVDFQRHADAL